MGHFSWLLLHRGVAISSNHANKSFQCCSYKVLILCGLPIATILYIKVVAGVGFAPTSLGLQPSAFTRLAYQPRYIADIPS